mgnify:CR=1 FL=1
MLEIDVADFVVIAAGMADEPVEFAPVRLLPVGCGVALVDLVDDCLALFQVFSAPLFQLFKVLGSGFVGLLAGLVEGLP